MQYQRRVHSWWGVVASAAVHALLLGALLRENRAPLPADTPGALLQVALLAAPPAPAPGASAPGAAPLPAVAPRRAAIHYYGPDEVERQLIVLRDPAADQLIALTHPIVLQLFVDRQGRVADLSITAVEEKPLAPHLEAQVRAAFMQLEFLPALRGGQPVPAYLRIELAAQEP